MVAAFENISILQNGQVIVDNVSFTIDKGEFIYLVGKTGSGKSSILRTLYADLDLENGKAQVLGYNLAKIKQKDIAYLRRRLGIVFQDFELFTDRTVEANLLFVLKATGWNNPYRTDQRIDEVLEAVELVGSRAKMPHQLSAGEQQRVVIARALLNNPELLIADEPTGNLDPYVATEILNLFVEINKKGTAVLMATHYHSFIKKMPARVFMCEEGLFKDVKKDEVASYVN